MRFSGDTNDDGKLEFFPGNQIDTISWQTEYKALQIRDLILPLRGNDEGARSGGNPNRKLSSASKELDF